MVRYEKEFKEQALALSDESGVKSAAEKLGIPYGTLSEWRKARANRGVEAFVGSGHRYIGLKNATPRELELERENRDLRKANDILKDALGFFARDRMR
jgi:transposase